MRTRITALLAGAAMAVALVLPAAAATSYTLFGDAEVVAGGQPGNAAQLRSDNEPEVECGGVPCGGVELAGFPTDPTAITALSFDYNANGTGASGGSPRLVVSFSDGGSADLRPLDLVAGTWVTVGGMTGNNWDANGGTCGYLYATTWDDIVACHVGATIDGMWVVNDSGWAFPPDGLVVLVDNITVNLDVITFDAAVATSKEQCKKGGWAELARVDGTAFRNQGDCVSYTNNGK